MNILNSRFTISTVAVAACAMVALVVAEPAQAQTPVQASASVQRIEIVGRRLVPLQRIEIVGKRIAEPGVQRIVIVGQRLRDERVALAADKARAL